MNKYFVYENGILKAAQPTLVIAMQYFNADRIMLKGDPGRHVTDLTTICKRLKFIDVD